MVRRRQPPDDSLIDFLLGVFAVLSMVFAVTCVIVMAVNST